MGVYPTNVEASPEAMANYAMVSMMLMSLHRREETGTKAVLYYPGVFDTEMRQRLGDWSLGLDYTSYDHVLVAGHHAEAGQHHFLTTDVVADVFGPGAGIYCQVHARHTGEQASWTAQKAQELELDVVELFVPAFHLPRAYLTTLKAFIKAGIDKDVLLLPRALPMDPVAALPMVPPFEDGGYMQRELVGGEAHKMLAYIADVATLAELEQYLVHHL